MSSTSTAPTRRRRCATVKFADVPPEVAMASSMVGAVDVATHGLRREWRQCMRASSLAGRDVRRRMVGQAHGVVLFDRAFWHALVEDAAQDKQQLRAIVPAYDAVRERCDPLSRVALVDAMRFRAQLEEMIAARL